MRKLLFLLSCLISLQTWAHSSSYEQTLLHDWHLKNQTTVQGSFLNIQGNEVFIQDKDGNIKTLPLNELKTPDYYYVQQKIEKINRINHWNKKETNASKDAFLFFPYLLAFLASFFMFEFLLGLHFHRKWYLTTMICGIIFFISLSFTEKTVNSNKTNASLAFLDSSFAPFFSTIHTYSDATYYYVESNGIPTTHTMMVGISSKGWQQQVPIPQCYIGANAWPIPLNPSRAASPIPVDSIHFTRGAVALAINGVPIFNVHTNTGVDSYLDGQLDSYGGHCGRADDYHYHIAPLHLYAYTASTKPIAFGLDGYAVYGDKEPDGSSMMPLDSNHGHVDAVNGYHYHGTATAPYMIARMAGKVTEDGTHQLIPQAAAQPVRPALTPLSGAVITACYPNAAKNGYTLVYSFKGNYDTVAYSWDNAGNYTFNFDSAHIKKTIQYNNKFIQCQVPKTIMSVSNPSASQQPIVVFMKEENHILVNVSEDKSGNDVKGIAVFNTQGKIVYSSKSAPQTIETAGWSKGMYLVQLQVGPTIQTQKIIVE